MEFAGQLIRFTDTFVKLGSNLAEIEAAHATAVKTVEAEKKKEIESKRRASFSKTPPATAEAKPGAVMKDGKPVFGTKTATGETPSLFDSPSATAASEESRHGRAVPAAGQLAAAAQAEPASRTNPAVETAAVRPPGLEQTKKDVGCQSS